MSGLTRHFNFALMFLTSSPCVYAGEDVNSTVWSKSPDAIAALAWLRRLIGLAIQRAVYIPNSVAIANAPKHSKKVALIEPRVSAIASCPFLKER